RVDRVQFELRLHGLYSRPRERTDLSSTQTDCLSCGGLWQTRKNPPGGGAPGGLSVQKFRGKNFRSGNARRYITFPAECKIFAAFSVRYRTNARRRRVGKGARVRRAHHLEFRTMVGASPDVHSRGAVALPTLLALTMK